MCEYEKSLTKVLYTTNFEAILSHFKTLDISRF